jgi:hypothetical protein
VLDREALWLSRESVGLARAAGLADCRFLHQADDGPQQFADFLGALAQLVGGFFEAGGDFVGLRAPLTA